MLSAVFVGAGKPLALEERPIPEAGPHQAVIRVGRCGICASDMHMTSGSAFDVPCGTAMGHEYAGEVVAIGPDGWLKVGDRVTALPMAGCGRCEACRADRPLHCPELRSMAGGYGEYTLIDQRVAMRLPASLSLEDGALVEPLASALRGVRKLDITPETRIAVIGVGAIGASAIFWARRAGADRIVALTRTRRHAELAQTMGADALVTDAGALPDMLGGAPDIVIEAAGARGMLQQAIDLIRPAGTILSLGGCVVPDTILPVLGMWREATIRFSVAYGTSEFREAIDTLDSGAVAPRAMVGETIPLSALPERFEQMRTGSHAAKVMVDPQAR